MIRRPYNPKDFSPPWGKNHCQANSFGAFLYFLFSRFIRNTPAKLRSMSLRYSAFKNSRWACRVSLPGR